MEKAEYVDRVAIRKKVCTGCTMLVDGVCRDADPCENLIAGFLEAPAADVAPVRRGRWVDVREKRLFGEHYFLCSNCKTRNGSMIPFNYCPNCGAIMDKEEP